MSYKVQYSAEAKQDLRDIFNYIVLELLVPDTAKNQTLQRTRHCKEPDTKNYGCSKILG